MILKKETDFLSVLPLFFLGVKSGFVVKERFFRRAGAGSSHDPLKREDFLERVRRDWKDWNDHGHKFDHVIVNDGPIEMAVDKILTIIADPQLDP